MKVASSPPGISGLSEQHSQAILELLIQKPEVEAVVQAPWQPTSSAIRSWDMRPDACRLGGPARVEARPA